METYSVAFIGIIVPSNQLIIHEKTKTLIGENSNFPDDYAYCPISGQPLWQISKKYRKELGINDKNGFLDIDGYKMLNLGRFNIKDYDKYLIAMEYIVNQPLSEKNNWSRLPINEIFLNRIEKFKSVMKEKGLWNDTFGLYFKNCFG